VTLILGPGSNRKPMGMVFTSGKMAIDTKVNGKTVLSMAKEQTSSQWVMFTTASTSLANPTVLVNTNGGIIVPMLVNSQMVSSMAKASGERKEKM
jgi:hypothetical protein